MISASFISEIFSSVYSSYASCNVIEISSSELSSSSESMSSSSITLSAFFLFSSSSKAIFLSSSVG